jgi:hypothetical protein
MSSEEGQHGCEVCKDSAFVLKFCRNIGGDDECRVMSERAARGELSEEDYFAWIIDKFGPDAADAAFQKTMVEHQGVAAEEMLRPSEAAVPVSQRPARPRATRTARSASGVSMGVTSQEPAQFPAAPAVEAAPAAAATPVARAELNYRSGIKSICLPCIGKTWAAILDVVAMWFGEDDKKKIQTCILELSSGKKSVEEAVADALTITGVKAAMNVVLADMNKVLDLSVDSALRKRPEMAEEIKAE